MPAITVKMGKTPPEKKKELIEKLTMAATEVTAMPAEYFSIYIQEFEADSIGVGGQTIAEKFAK